MYSRLPPEPQRKEPDVDMFPSAHEEGIKYGLGSYLDEFLSAIKIFGYLERPVFHELTRSMQTRKLIAGETLNLEEEQGFCLVVDGLVDIFVKSGPRPLVGEAPSASFYDSSGEDDRYPGPGHQRYQLLTEVRNGAPMSSLFSIMSLFTEDVGLRSPEDDLANTSPSSVDISRTGFRGRSSIPTPDPSGSKDIIPPLPDQESPIEGADGLQYSSEAKTPKVTHVSLDDGRSHAPIRPALNRRAASVSAHPDIIARATVDTTIAIIPASAFRRLIKTYPKATAQIVHLILTRFLRVTLATAYNYLGLTEEVLHTEKSVVRYTMCQLPNPLRGEPLDRLKQKFERERERIGEDEQDKGIALHNATARQRRTPSSTNLRKEAMLQSMSMHRTSLSGMTISPPRETPPYHSPSPGDLLSNVQLDRHAGRRLSTATDFLSHPTPDLPRKETNKRKEVNGQVPQRSFDPFDGKPRSPFNHGRESVDEDNVFRVSVLECMFKALGFGSGTTSRREPESSEGSPRLPSFDHKSRNVVFSSVGGGGSNAFGFMGPLDGSADGETESMASTNVAMGTPPGAHALALDMKHEVEIVFFPKGSVLIEQGERSPGLYYVIDGFLDICSSHDEGSIDMFPDPHRHTSGGFSGPSAGDEDTIPFPPFPSDNVAQDNKPKKNGQRSRRSVALIKPGGLAGYIGSVSSYRSFIDVVAKTDVYVGFLPRAPLERIVDKYPIALLTMAKRLTNLLPRLILHIDFALEWVQVNAGEVMFRKNDESEAIYIVLNGRLRLVEDKKEGGVKVRDEFGQGESVGELEVLTESTRPGTLHAIRDAELVKFPRTLFNSLAQEHPNITIKISKIIASRMRTLFDDPSKFILKDGSAAVAASFKGSSTVNLRTVAILPVTSGVPVVEFGNRLMSALAQVGPPNGATSLNQEAILSHLGRHAFNKMGKLKLSQYLADLEEKYSLVLYVAGKFLIFLGLCTAK